MRMGVGRLLRVLALLVAVLALGLAAGCGGDEEAVPAETEAPGARRQRRRRRRPRPRRRQGRVAIVGIVAPEEANDYSWNQQGVEGAEAAAAASGATAEVADGAGYEDITPILQQLADDGANLIIAHASGYNTAAPEWAAESGIPVLVPDNPAATTPGLVANMVFKSEQGAYLAGVLAAKMTKTGTLGLVVSADNENWNKQSGAFAAGAQSANPDDQDPARADRRGCLRRRRGRQAGDRERDRRGRGHHLRHG